MALPARPRHVVVYDQADNLQKRRFTFRLLRHTGWQTFNASPEPVKNGLPGAGPVAPVEGTARPLRRRAKAATGTNVDAVAPLSSSHSDNEQQSDYGN